jgi:hypothetical protein
MVIYWLAVEGMGWLSGISALSIAEGRRSLERQWAASVFNRARSLALPQSAGFAKRIRREFVALRGTTNAVRTPHWHRALFCQLAERCRARNLQSHRPGRSASAC